MNNDKTTEPTTASSVAFATVAVACLSAMALLVAGNAAFRYLFAAPQSWAQDYSELALAALFFLALPFSWHCDAHVRMEVSEIPLLSGKMKKAIELTSDILLIAGCGVLCWQGVAEANRSHALGLTSPAGAYDLAVLGMVIAVGSAATALVGLARIWNTTATFRERP